MRSIRLGGAAVAVALALAACGGGTSAPPAATGSSPSASAPASAGSSSPAASAGAVCEESTDAGTVTVSIANNAYDPTPVQAGVGDVIAWTNEDSVPHTATFTAEGCATDNLNQGQSGAIVFNVPGTYEYICSVHPTTMSGEVVIS
jgi:plastocyanin